LVYRIIVLTWGAFQKWSVPLKDSKIMQTISFKWVVKGGHIEGISAFMNPYLYLIDRDPKSKWDGWETRKIDYGLRDIYVTIRAKEVDYDKELIKIVPHPWYAYNSVKYEVKPNPYGIEEILFIRGKGWFVAGEELALWRVYR